MSITSNLPLGEDPIEILGPAPDDGSLLADLVEHADQSSRLYAALPEFVRAARLAAAIRAPINIVDLCAVATSARVALKRAGLDS